MKTHSLSPQITAAGTTMTAFSQFFTDSPYAKHGRDPNICDFVFGNPHEMPLPEFVQALGQWSVPQDTRWFAYKDNDPASCAIVAATLRERHGLAFDADSILMTNGAFGAIAVVLQALVSAGDEVVFNSPPWFFYEAMIAARGATPVRVKVDPQTFDLDLDAIEAALTERTRLVIINSPNNPTGKIYPPATLQRLADLLTTAGERYGQPVYLLSDEAYSRIVFDGRAFHSATAYYPYTLLVYTYGKTLLTPGQRIGYIALPPSMPERGTLRDALFFAQLVTGWSFPNALLQHALPDLERLSIDIDHLQRKRDRMVAALLAMGYETYPPEGTFYLVVRSPLPDDLRFCEILAAHNVFVLPGSIAELPGYVRISLTANDDMIERSLPGFAGALQDALHENAFVQ